MNLGPIFSNNARCPFTRIIGLIVLSVNYRFWTGLHVKGAPADAYLLTVGLETIFRPNTQSYNLSPNLHLRTRRREVRTCIDGPFLVVLCEFYTFGLVAQLILTTLYCHSKTCHLFFQTVDFLTISNLALKVKHFFRIRAFF